MEEDFDIYEDLDFGKKKHEDNHQVQGNCKELIEKVEKLEEKVKHLETELTNEANQRKVLETNFSSLLKTAKNELSRKDRIISDLRAQIDNFYFRRNKVHVPINDGTKNNSNSSEAKKDPEPISKCIVEKKQEKVDNLDKSLPMYFSPLPQLISRLEPISDDEDMEIICQPKQLTSTVFGERLKKRLKDQEEKERLQMEQAKSLTSIPKSNEIVDNKTEVKSTSVNNMDNKENQYRLISLDISPKKNCKRGNEEKANETPDKRKKYLELSEASQSCKSKKIEHIENSGSCTDKFITNIHTNEYFCSVENGNNSLENVDRYQKKSLENDTKVHSSRNMDDQRNDRYCKKYWNNEYRDNRSKSGSRMNLDSEKNYSFIDRGRSRGRNKPYDGRGKRNYYNREDDFNRDRSRSHFDSRNHIKQWQHNEIAYENDVNERRYPDEKIYAEVRRSRRIEARSHSHHAGYKKDNNNYRYKDNYKNRQHEEKNRTRRRSRSRERSCEKSSADSTSSRKNDSEQIDDVKDNRIELNKSLEDGEILDNQAIDEEMNIINIFEGNEKIVQSNLLNPVIQSPKEERIENIQEFIRKFDVKKEVIKSNNKNTKKNTDSSTDNTVKNNNSKDNHHNKPDNSKQEKKENIQKVYLDQQLVDKNIPNIKKVNSKENMRSQEIVIKKNDQPQDSKLELPSNDHSKPISNNVELKENKCDTNEIKIIQNNEDKNNLDKQSEAVINLTKIKESTIKQKPKIVNIDNFTATRDPEYCKILSKYLKKKPKLHDSTSSETCTTNVTKSDKENTQNKNEKNIEVTCSKQVENIKSEKCEKEKPLKVESEKCMKLNSSLEKSEESSSSSTSSVLKVVCEPEPIADLADEKVKNNECFVSPIPINPVKRAVNKNKINVKKPSTSNESEVKKTVAPRKKKEKVDENQNSSANKGVMILTTRRRPIKLSNFSSSVTVVSTIQNVDSNQISKTTLEAIKE